MYIHHVMYMFYFLLLHVCINAVWVRYMYVQCRFLSRYMVCYSHAFPYVHTYMYVYIILTICKDRLLLALKSSEFLNGEVTSFLTHNSWFTSVSTHYLQTPQHQIGTSITFSFTCTAIGHQYFVGPFLTSKAIHVHVVECHFHMQFMTKRGFCLCSHGSLKLNVFQFEKSNYHIRRSMHVHRYSKISF